MTTSQSSKHVIKSHLMGATLVLAITNNMYPYSKTLSAVWMSCCCVFNFGEAPD